MRRKSRIIFLVVILALLAVLAYGFAAQNTVDSSYAGDGWAGVSGYYVKNIQYTLDSADPSLVASVSFSLQDSAGNDLPATTVYAAVADDNAGTPGTWTWSNACTQDATTLVWSCSWGTEPAVVNIYYFRVSAGQ